MIDPTKKYRTRDGRQARVICTNKKSHNYPIVALVTQNGEEVEYTLTAQGRFVDCETESDHDLIEVCEPRMVWVNEYECGTYCVYNSERQAMLMATDSAIRVAVKYIEAQ